MYLSSFSTYPRFIFAAVVVFAVLSGNAQAQFNTTTNSDGSLTISLYTGSGGAVSIPSEINGLPVTSIGDGAFLGCLSLTSVTIPDSVTSIGDRAFAACFSMASVTIGSNVTSIGDGAFNNCVRLTSVTIPNSVTSIGDGPFEDCTSLTAINVDPSNPDYSSDVNGVLFNQNQTTLIQYPAGNVGTAYSIPSTVTSIREFAFVGCTSLSSVTIPNSVTSIGDGAFAECINLIAINVDPNNPAYSSVAGVLFNQNQTTLIQYPTGNGGSSYTIPNSVTSIGDLAFDHCLSLSSVTIPNSVTSIGGYAFASCYNLTGVTIGNGVTSIGVQAFVGCTSLASVTIGSSVTSIGDLAFAGCYSLASVFFTGNTPIADPSAFSSDNNATAYYLLGNSGWDFPFAGLPIVILNPPMITTPPASAAVVAGANVSFTVTASANPAPIVYTWQVSTDGGNTWNNVSGSAYAGATTANLTITNATTALLGYQYQAIITNYAGTTTSPPVPLVVGISSAQMTWLQNNFTSAQLGNPAIVGDLATPANDGIPNLLKYALNLNPWTDEHLFLPQPTLSTGNLVLTFQAPQTDIIYTVQASEDLINWATTGVTVQANGNQVIASYALPASGLAFLRLQVAPAP